MTTAEAIVELALFIVPALILYLIHYSEEKAD